MLNDLYHSIDPVAFTVGPFSVRWYGIAYVLGFICVGLTIWFVAKRWKLKLTSDAVLTYMLCVMIGVILGARLGYVIFYGAGEYFIHPEDIFAFHKGGMSFHGGLVGAVIGAFVASKLIHVPFMTLGDLTVIGAPIGLFFGRCANFINGELWGAVTDVPWGVVFGGSAGTLPRHPSQLYEALLEGLVIFIVLFAMSRKVPPRPRGTYLGVFLVLYGIFRFAIEFIRSPDAQLGWLLGDWFTMGQLLSIPVVIAGIVILILASRKQLPQQGIDEAYLEK